MDDPFEILEKLESPRTLFLSDRESGLRAIIVLDSLALGPAAGGIRTRAYPDTEAAWADCVGLAKAMTLKCALGGLSAGGGKAVVIDHTGLDRKAAFTVLGKRVEELRGMFRTAGDLGTRKEDLLAVASQTRYVHTEEGDLAAAVGRGAVRCMQACVARHGGNGLRGLTVAIQGCGVIGSAVARALAKAGARLILSDVANDRALTIAEELGAEVVAPDRILSAEADILSPCAIGGVVTTTVAQELRAWAVCGASNNIIASAEAEDVLLERGILHVPDTVASAGAVIDGIGRTVMGLSDRTSLIDNLGATAARILSLAAESGNRPSDVAAALAAERIARPSR
jgi:leucine dehydrogenase